jgi:phosphate/sulfate permease
MFRAVPGPRDNRSRGGQRLCAFAAGLAVMLAFVCPAASAQPQTAKIAVALSLTGPNASIGRPDLEGARLAIEEATAAGGAPPIELSVYDDASNAAEGARLAHEIGDGDATLRNIVLAWVLTLPCAIVLSASLYWFFVRAL